MMYTFANRMSLFSSSAVRDILKLTQGRDIISLSGGLPAEECFPVDALKAAFDSMFEGNSKALQYGITEGYYPLRQRIAARMTAKGISASPEQLLLTTGSQQTIDLVARIFLEEGDVVLTENPTYLAALQVFQASGAQITGVDGDSDGITPALLEEAIRLHQPKLLYVIPTFANPTGKVWSLERRQQILDICTKYNVLILEDDPYGELSFDEKSASLPSLMALSRSVEGSPVIYTSTFSKTVVPALRTGWAVADEQIIRMMAKAKQSADLHSSCLDQQALDRLMAGFDLDAHIEGLREVYGERMRTMVNCLQKDPVWQDVRYTVPSGGMFLWLELPEGSDTEALLPYAIEAGVAFVPGSGFFTSTESGLARRTMRLNFSHSSPALILDGMARLSAAYSRYSEQLGAAAIS